MHPLARQVEEKDVEALRQLYRDLSSCRQLTRQFKLARPPLRNYFRFLFPFLWPFFLSSTTA
jgi:hypothetical protein